MQPVLILRTPNGEYSDLPKSKGNVLLDLLVGADIRLCDPPNYRNRQTIFDDLEKELRTKGHTPFCIPEGGSNSVGSLGYVNAAFEIAEQTKDKRPTSIVVPVGSGGTLAGLVVGVKEAGLNIPVIGLAVCDDTETFVKIVDDIAAQLHKDYNYAQISHEDYKVIDKYKGIGYAQSTPEELTLLTKTASEEAVLFDPVYTIKAWRGFIEEVKSSKDLGDRPLFIHTGGIYGVMAEGEAIQAHCKRD